MNNNIKTTENGKIVSKSALEIATDYHLRGWYPIPIPTRSKNPNFPNWCVVSRSKMCRSTTHPENDPKNELAQDFHNNIAKPQSIGILLGKPSNDLVDIDLDAKCAVQHTTFFCRKQKRYSDAIIKGEVITFITALKPKPRSFNFPK